MSKIIKLLLCGYLTLCAFSGYANQKLTHNEERAMIQEGKALLIKHPVSVKKRPENKQLRIAKNRIATPLAKLDRKTPETFAIGKKSVGARISSKTPIYGYVYYSMEYDTQALYKVEGDDFQLLWYDPFFESDVMVEASEGWYEEGKVNGVAIMRSDNVVTGYVSYSIDFDSGELLYWDDLGLEIPIMFINPTFNPDDGNIYGFAYDFDNDGKICWAVANPYDLHTTKVLNDKTTYCYSLCYNSSNQKFYGVNTNQEFVSIDTEGNQTVITNVPDAQNFATYFAGLVWVPSSEAFYWNAQYADDSSAMYKITLDGEFALEDYYADGTEFTYLFTTESPIIPDIPARPSFNTINFKGGSLQGDIVFTLPSQMGDGTPIPQDSPMSYTILLDDVIYTTGESRSGNDVSIEFSLSTPGYHKFGIFVTYNGDNSSISYRTLWLGNDTPLVPSDVKMTENEVSWKAVGDQGIHGGYVNVNEVIYEVYVNDELMGSTSSTSLKINLPEDATLAKYSATVYAVFDGKKGKGGSSNSILAGKPYQVPVYFEPTLEEFELMVIEDKNSDGITWSYWKDHNALGTLYTYNYEDYFDDYIFLPPIEISNTDKYYVFSLEAAIRANNYPDEYLEVVYASAPSSEAIMGVLVPEFAPTASQYETPWTRKEGLLKVSTPGTYYIGIHATSPGDQLGLLAKAFRLNEAEINEDSPAAPKILDVIPGSNGELKATVKFAYPELLLNGLQIDQNTILTLNVLVNGEKVYIDQSGKPGEESSFIVETVQGRNEISISVTADGLDSPSEITNIFTGQNLAATPKNLKSEESEDMMSIKLSWDAVTTPDKRGDYINPEDVRYAVYVQVQNIVSYHWQLISDGITDTHCTIRLQEGAPMDEYTFGIASYNPAGSNDEVVTVSAYLGTPYSLPYSEDFENEEYTFQTAPWFVYPNFNGQSYNAQWYTFMLDQVDEYFAGDKQTVLYCLPQANRDKGLIGMPRFSTRDCGTAQINLQIVEGPAATDFNILGEIYGNSQLITVASYEQSQTDDTKISTLTYELPQELLNQYWVQLYLEPVFKTKDKIFIVCSIDITSTTSVESISGEDGRIEGGKGYIEIEGYAGLNAKVFSIDGKLMKNILKISDHEVLDIAPGVYIVNVKNNVRKVIVR
ncbi:MAG: T9SS type A sorting domain-containing protein [Muribaculaceae bacterium]|nr:T9SS type A sorting domain-containing protein [Muribaculaceae bacterium]